MPSKQFQKKPDEDISYAGINGLFFFFLHKLTTSASNLQDWLQEIGSRAKAPLLQYVPLFTLGGVTWETIKTEALDKELLIKIGVNKAAHRKILVKASKILRKEGSRSYSQISHFTF